MFCSDVPSASTKRQEDAALGWSSEVAPSVGDGEVIQLRQWGTDQVHVLPRPLIQDGFAGIVTTCSLRFTDLGILLEHAELAYEHNQWRIRDLEGMVDLRQDGEPRREFVLTPGVEVGIGTTTLIAESKRSIALREFCARVLGWGTGRMGAVDHALRAIRFAAAWRSTLVLRGEEDLVPLAHALHRRVLGADAPFVVCDRRREDLPASVRSPANRGSSVAAFEIAAGGSLCVRGRRLPHDLPELLKLLCEPGHRVQLIVCMRRHARAEFPAGSVPIEVPPLGVRETELSRIVHAYAEDAIAALSAPISSFSEEDHGWVMQHSAESLSEIEKATLRLVALNMTDNVHQAARLLGMAQVSLSRWFHRRMRLRTRAVIGNS